MARSAPGGPATAPWARSVTTSSTSWLGDSPPRARSSELAALGPEVNDSGAAETAAALAADAARFALRGPITEAPFIGACSAGHAAAGLDGEQAAFDTAFAEERAFESAWLATRLALAAR